MFEPFQALMVKLRRKDVQKLVIGFSWKAVFTKRRLQIYSLLAVALLLLGLLELLGAVPPYWFLNAALSVFCLGGLELVFIPISNQLDELGMFLSPDWFLHHGIRGVVTFTGIRKESGAVFSGSRMRGSMRGNVEVNKFCANGINPVTLEEQEFIQLCAANDRRRFRPGDKIFIYVHPEKPSRVYWIDLSFSSPAESTRE